MPTQGPLSPSTIVNDSSVGGASWSGPGDAATSNDIYATVSLGGGQISHFLKCTGFGFSIPSSDTINGAVLEYERSVGSAPCRDNIVKLVVGGVISGNNNADTVNSWPSGADSYLVRGGASDLWGLPLTPAIVNASDFGAAISVMRPSGTFPAISGKIDHVRITIYHTTGVTTATGSWFYMF